MKNMKINGYILREELDCCEGANLKSDKKRLSVSNCIIYREHMDLRPYYVYITNVGMLEKLSRPLDMLTVVCIGEPDDRIKLLEYMDLIWVKAYMQPFVVFSQIQKILNKYKEITEQLTLLCRSNHTGEELIRFMVESIKNPVIIFGAFHEVLAVCEEPAHYRFPCQVKGAFSDFVSKEFLHLFDGASQSLWEKEGHGATKEGIPFYQYGLYRKDASCLFIFVLGITHPVTECEKLLLIHMAPYLECRVKNRIVYPFQGLYCFHRELRNYYHMGEWEQEEGHACVINSLKTIGFHMFDSYLCIAVKTIHDGPVSDGDIPKDMKLMRGCVMLMLENEVIFIINLRKMGMNENQAIKKMRTFLNDSVLFCGVSTVFQNFYDFPDYCRQALAAIRIGKKINYADKFYLFQEYALDYIIYEGWEALPYNVALFGQLKYLIDYDKANKVHYCETLKMFFHHDMKMSQTANALGIHISTLKYRINRIRDMLELDFDNFTSRLYLQLVMDLLK